MVAAAVLEAPSRVEEFGILLVEDDETARVALRDLLRKKGYAVVATESGHGAMLEARRGRVGVVLMDIDLGDVEMDGIDAAERIHSEHPFTSFIFVTAHTENPEYRARVSESPIRVGDWMQKPLNVERLLELIDEEYRTLALLAAAAGAVARGLDPVSYVEGRAEVDGALTSGIVARVKAELQAAEAGSAPSISSPGARRTEIMGLLSTEIDETYDQIRDLVADSGGTDGLEQSLLPLRAKLRRLQAREAELIEEHFRSGLHFNARRARETEERVREIVGEL